MRARFVLFCACSTKSLPPDYLFSNRARTSNVVLCCSGIVCVGGVVVEMNYFCFDLHNQIALASSPYSQHHPPRAHAANVLSLFRASSSSSPLAPPQLLRPTSG